MPVFGGSYMGQNLLSDMSPSRIHTWRRRAHFEFARRYPELGRGQQTLHEAVNSHRIYEPVTGVHPRVELPDEAFEEWFDGNQEVEYVVINFSDADEVKEQGRRSEPGSRAVAYPGYPLAQSTMTM